MTEIKPLNWGILDIQEVRQDLDDKQALMVLYYIKGNYKRGVTEQVIRTMANELYPESKS
jgi:hypothetical protein